MSSGDFNISLVQSFIEQLRFRGDKALRSLFSENARSLPETKDCSTIFLSWCLYSLHSQKPPLDAVLQLVEADIEVGKSTLAQNIFSRSPRRPSDQHYSLCNEAVNIIETCWPDLYSLFQTINPRFCQADTEKPESQSDIKLFGQIFFNMGRKNPTGWAEIIAHELGHHYLFVSYAAFHKNVDAPWEKLVHSEIRKEQRPLIGVMHAVVAETCMILLAIKILGHDNFSKHHKDARLLLDRQSKNLQIDYETASKFEVFEMDAGVSRLITDAVNVAKSGEGL